MKQDDPNILKPLVVLLHKANPWEHQLRKACLELNLAVLNTESPTDIPELICRKENIIVLVDHRVPDVTPRSLSEKSKNVLWVGLRPVDAAGKDSEQDGPLLEEFDHVMYMSTSRAVLMKSLRFYIETLGARRQLSRVLDSHDTIKKNLNLTHQVINLQGQLNQFNTNLQTQEEVLNTLIRISQLSRQINCLDAKRISMVCIEKIPKLIAARYASMYLYDESRNELRLLRHNHPYAIEEVISVDENPSSPMAIAIKQKKLLLIRDFDQWRKETNLDIQRLYERNYQTGSCIIAPLNSSGRIAGLLNLADKMDDSGFDHSRDLPPIELLCEIIGSAMSNIQLYEEVRKQARTDGMTQLVNHDTFYNELDKEVSRSQRYGGHLSLIMIDMDRLKTINDQHGHRAGDAMIKHISDHIRHCVREIDVAARYGGDEFAIILPNTSLADALVVAQRLLEGVSSEPVDIGDRQLHVTVSIGIAHYDRSMTTEGFMKEADGALLTAKNAGKNCIHVADVTSTAR